MIFGPLFGVDRNLGVTGLV